MASKNLYRDQDSEGFVPAPLFDEWCQRNKISRNPDRITFPRWDGWYSPRSERKVHPYDTTNVYYNWSYLRFYPDGTVLYHTESGKHFPSDESIASTFAIGNKAIKSRGVYKQRGEQITLETSSTETIAGLSLIGICSDIAIEFAVYTGETKTYHFKPIRAYLNEFLSHVRASSFPTQASPLSTAPQKKSLTFSEQFDVRQLEHTAHEQFMAHRFDLALPIYDQILHIDPTSDRAYAGKSSCFRWLGSYYPALAAIDQACYFNPMVAHHHSERGELLLKVGRFLDALGAFERCILISAPGSAENMSAWWEKHKLLLRLGWRKEADEALHYYEQSRIMPVPTQQEPQMQASTSSVPLQTPPPSTTAGQLVPRLTHNIGTTFVTYQQPGSKVDGLAWSPDGKRIVSFGLGKAQVWTPSSGSVLYTYDVKGITTIITAIAWSPDSTRIATAGSDKVVQVWDASDGHGIAAYKGGHHKFIRGVAWSPNGQHIASCEDNELHIWNAVSGQHVFTFTAHPKALVGVRSLAWSPDGTRIATGGGDNHVVVWNPQDGSVIATYTQQRNTINGLAWSPDGKRIASASSDNSLHIWTAEMGADPIICKGHTRSVNAVAFSPDGKRIATASDDATARIWNSETGEMLFTYKGHKNAVKALAWSSDNIAIASGGDDKTVQVWACG